MGLGIYCDILGFYSSYTRWNEIKIEIIKGTIDYIKNKYDEDIKLYGDITDEDDENYIGEHTNYNYYIKCLLELKSEINNFLTQCHNFEYINALKYFDVAGLLALCNQDGYEGFYTCGNSIDICLLLEKIEPFMKKYANYSSIYSTDKHQHYSGLYEVFKHSAKIMKRIIIE